MHVVVGEQNHKMNEMETMVEALELKHYNTELEMIAIRKQNKKIQIKYENQQQQQQKQRQRQQQQQQQKQQKQLQLLFFYFQIMSLIRTFNNRYIVFKSIS